LTNANSSVSTYNRYTYYRMLSQMGVDSAPEQNKLNLNYRNETNGVILPNLETNFIPWTALEFFTNAADRMLRTYSRQWLAESPSNFLATYGSFANFGTLANPTNVPVSFGISDIPVYVNSNFVYTPAVQRVLQLAANIYDATTNNTLAQGANYPSVFRPTFLVADDPVSGSRNVYINGYKQVVSVPLGGSDPQLALPVNVTDLTAPPFGLGVWTNVNVYGVPWVIGTKKGFPNFNEFSLQSLVGITRRLQVTRPATNAPPPASVDFSRFHTNEMYTMCVSNWVGVEFWNSYTNNYVPVSGLSIWVRGNLSMTLTNDDGMAPVYLNPLNPPTHYLPLDNSVLIASPQYWPGVLPWDGDGHATNASFDIPLYTNVVMQLNPAYVATSNWWTYSFNSHQFVPVPNTPIYETVSGFPFPHFGLVTTNRLQVFMLDGTHVVDYAQFAGPDNLRDLNAEIFNDQNASSDVWITNSSGASATFGVPDGILNQLRISRGSLSSPNFSDDGIWHADPEAVPYGGTKEQQQAYFDGFFRAGNIGRAGGETAENLQLTNQAPYSPTRYVVLYTTWQANDPLVHYTPGDLNFTWNTGGDLVPGTNRFNYGNSMPVLPNIGSLNDHYMPWGRSLLAPGADTNAYNLAVKDPLVWQSQDWDFPAYKFPTVGWLGRVHRGTPWQTVYLKSFDVLRETIVKGATISYVGTNTWSQWTGDTQLANGQNYDAANSAPVQDRLLFDVFTTALNDNATRGQLSVNVAAGETNNPLAGLAAWSAVFSGVIPLADTPVTPFFNPLTEQGVQHANLVTNYTALSPINPAGRAGASSILGGIVTNINLTRTAFTNADGLAGSFEHVGDILTAPQLTVQSPFLNWANVAQQANGISDELYEWLPQQLMSLLRVDDTPRYVIYSYGQALKPAPNGIYTGGGAYFGMVTNYQVVAEAATRAVVRFNGIRTNIITTVVTFDSSGNKITNLVNLPVVTNNTAVVEQFNTLPSN